MKKYELMFIITPDASEDERTATVTYVENALNSIAAAEMVVEKMGERKLAYPINKKNTGFYVLVKFDVDGEKLIDFEKKININEKVIRYILVKKD